MEAATTSAPPAAAEKPKAERVDTEYHVFVQDTDADHGEQRGWFIESTVAAPNQQAAIRAAVSNMDLTPDAARALQFAAVPVRSWRPVSAKVEVETKLSIG